MFRALRGTKDLNTRHSGKNLLPLLTPDQITPFAYLLIFRRLHFDLNLLSACWFIYSMIGSLRAWLRLPCILFILFWGCERTFSSYGQRGLLSRCSGFSCCETQALGARASVVATLWGSVVETRGLSCSLACGIFLDQGSNPCPLHQQANALDHQGSPKSALHF